MAKNYIKGIGIEMEGFWTKGRVFTENTEKHRDSSVYFREDDSDRLVFRIVHGNKIDKATKREMALVRYYEPIDGADEQIRKIERALESTEEIVSTVLKSKKQGIDFIDGNYPEIVNSNCGMHIHLSFKTKGCYTALASQEFYIAYNRFLDSFVSKVSKKSKDYFQLKDRADGNNDYCRQDFDPYGEDRYVQLNYAALDKHGTIENRTFPMFQSKTLAKKAFRQYLKFVNTWLRENKERIAKKCADLNRRGSEKVESIHVRGIRSEVLIPNY